MKAINRRQFLLLTTAFAAGCASTPGGKGATRTINAGPAAQYLRDGVYARYRDLGFFLIRQGPDLIAMSSICTHRNCKLELQKNQSYWCPCHDSAFDAEGHVTQGPAKRDLPKYPVTISEQNEVLVSLADS
ncbi:MAG TPA: Rieske (2Fe-2S) protein [Verrucomicrobiae bacterium]